MHLTYTVRSQMPPMMSWIQTPTNGGKAKDQLSSNTYGKMIDELTTVSDNNQKLSYDEIPQREMNIIERYLRQ